MKREPRISCPHSKGDIEMKLDITHFNIRTLLSSVVLCAVASTAFGQSSKVTAKVGEINVLDEINTPTAAKTGPWQSVLKNTLKTANEKDVFIGVSMEVGLLTGTLVRSKNGASDTSLADAAVEVRVLVDGNEALPGVVVFGRR